MTFWLAMRGAGPYKLEPGVDVTIGRGQHCDLSVYSTLLSREHARVRWEGEQPVLFDLESLNGCWVGVDRISRFPLKDGVVVRLGDFMIQFRESDVPPPELSEDELPQPFEVEPSDPDDDGSDTRLFSRTTALHQKVFEYDELYWLLEQVEGLTQPVQDPWIAEANLAVWYENLGSQAEEALWGLLAVGVIAPRDHRAELTGRAPLEVAEACALTKRGQRLRALLRERRVHWNEMAALRYRTRQGPIFQPMRQIARAYRPGLGLREMDAERLVYELVNIYAPGMPPETVELELRRLLCLGFLCPTPGQGASAWYPKEWNTATVSIAERGMAMLEGFRLEE